MSLNSLLQRSQARQTELRADRRHPRRRACLETLEARRLLSFNPTVPYATTSGPRAIATADFNGDGNPDLAATAGIDTNSRVILRMGDGAGGFGAAREFSAPAWGGYAGYLFVADLNNDTQTDMLLSDGINGYSTLIGNGDGSFQAPVNTPAFGLVYAGHLQPSNAVAGIRTWIGADWETHVQLQWGNGQGGFTPAGQDGQYWGNAAGMAPINLNDDPFLDVVTAEGTVFRGENWGLSFDWAQTAPLRGGAVATGDFTGDGYADVVVAGDSVAVLRSRGDGTLDAPILHPSNGTALSAVATADFNADAKLDVVVTERDTGTATVMLGNGDGTLRFGGVFAVGASPSSVTIGDFNRDGRPDVAAANNGSANLSVLLNDGNWAILPPPPPPPALSVGDVTVVEGNTGTRNAAFTATLSKPAAVDVSVYYGTQSGTATPTDDYSIVGGSVTIPAGQTTATINIAVVGDRIPEPDETFSVILNGATNAMITDGQGACTIVNDDVLPVISINNVSKAEGKSGTTSMTFTVTLSAAYDQAVTVNYATANGTAKAGSDYASKSGTLTFAPGESVKTVAVSVKGDTTREGNETFFVDLFGASGNALISVARGTGTILDDDNILRPLMRQWHSA
jgi:hypothetical protein